MTGKPQKVKAGGQLFRIAKEQGFRTGKPIFDAPENAEVKRTRVNPNTLAVGDVLVIPLLEPKVQNAATNQTLVLALDADELLLNLTLQDEARKPLANRAFRLVVGSRSLTRATPDLDPPIDGVTDGKGGLSAEINQNTGEGELTLRATSDPASTIVSVIRLLIGFLDAPNTEDGQRTRLNNMGYFAGFSANDTSQLKWAIEEFQADHGIKPTGRNDDRVTFNRIAHEHGDLLANETVP